MKKIFQTIVLACLITSAPFLRAEEPAAAEKAFEPTPAELSELIKGLPEEGVLYDAYLKVVNAPGNVGIQHEKIELKAEQLIWTRYQSFSIKETGAYDVVMVKEVYGLDGLFKSMEKTLEIMSSDLSITESLRQDDGKVHRVYKKVKDGQPETRESTHEDWSLAEGAIPGAWVPLAMMYHARQSRDRFVVRFSEPNRRGSYVEQSYEKSGTETLEIDGKQTLVNVYQWRLRSFRADGRESFPDKVKGGTTWVTDAGVVVKDIRKAADATGEYQWKHEAISAEQAEQWIKEAEKRGRAGDE